MSESPEDPFRTFLSGLPRGVQVLIGITVAVIAVAVVVSLVGWG